MWRSLLFVPTLAEQFVAKAATRGADAIILDLEASVAADRKDEARTVLPGAVERLAPLVPVTVRINPLWFPTLRDLEACVIPGVSAIHLALCENAEHVRAVDGIVTELETKRGLSLGQIKLIAMIETADALSQAAYIAKASPRLTGMTLGVEDYATSIGVAATPDLLRPATFQLNQAARAAGVFSYAVPVSMSSYQDTEDLGIQARYARSLGTTGGYAVHPRQVEVLNAVFSATEAEIAWAREVVAAASEAKQQGNAVFKVRGQMIDAPLIARAEQIIADFDKT